MPISLDSLCKTIDPKKTVLVFGAGSSIPSGAPSGKQLAHNLWHIVGKTTPQSDDLIETATLLERRYGRRDVIEAVCNEFSKLKPAGGLLSIPAFPWRQLFTTNFDKLIEQSFREARVDLITMRSNYDLSAKDSNSKAVLYKIHGCISQDRCFGDKASMILTEEDYETHKEFRQSLFTLLQTSLLTGDVLFIGQSLRDKHLSDMVKDVLRSKAQGSPGKVYVLIYDTDDIRAPILEDRGAKVAFGGIDQFFDTLAQGSTYEAPLNTSDDDILSVDLNSSTIDVIKAINLPPNVTKMFNGGAATYSDINTGATFERQKTDSIIQAIHSWDTPFVAITGAAGVGKSTFCRQLSLKLMELGYLCWEHREDFQFRHGAWVKVEAKLRHLGKRGVLLLDECTHYLRGANQLIDALSAIEDPHLSVILAANSSQWAPRIKSPNIYKRGARIELGLLHDSEIHSMLNLVEHNHTISKLVHTSFKRLPRSEQFTLLRRKCSADMFVCLKNIFANENLDNILLREYDELSDHLRDNYRYVAALESVGMRVHRHLLIRILHFDPISISGILSGLSGIIDEYEIDPTDGIYGWRTRHLVIARKIADYKFSGADELSALFHLIIENINPAVAVERHSISNICDTENGIGRIGDATTRLKLYKRLTEIAPGERIPWHRIIREHLLTHELEEAEYSIRDAEAAVGRDGPIDRFKVRLLILRSEKTPGISSTDRIAILRKAYELASKNIELRKLDRHSYKTLCEVALYLKERGADKYLIDEAIGKMRSATALICDPGMEEDLRQIELASERMN